MHGSSDPKPTMTFVVGLVGTIMVLVLVVFAIVLFQSVKGYEDTHKVIAARPQELLDLQSRQLERINEYRWVDREKGIVAIPIDRAMQLYVEKVESRPATPTIDTTGGMSDDAASPNETP